MPPSTAARHRSPRSSKKSAASVAELEAHLGFWLRFVSNHVSAQFQKLVEANGVSLSEWVALRQLYKSGEATAGELIDALGMTKGAISKLISRLQEKGLAARALVDGDGRAQQIVLTRAGRALVPRLAALADQNDELFFGHMDAAQRDALMSGMRDLVRFHGLKQVPVD
jgi:DNA-binding MarR family transcriptional regulator